MAQEAEFLEFITDFVEQAKKLAQNGDIGAAEVLLRQLIAAFPKSMPPRLLLARLDQAKQASEADALAEMGGDAEAALLPTPVFLSPTEQSADGKKHPTAVKEAAPSKTDQPLKPANLLAPSALKQRKNQKAQSGQKEAYITEARLAESREDYEAAASLWHDALLADPSDTWVYGQYAHLMSIHLARHEEAVSLYRQALQVDSTDDWVWGKLGIMLADLMGQVEEGLAHLDHAISLDPTEPYYHAWKGWVLYRLCEDYDAAILAFETAVTLWPDYAWALVQLGYCHQLAGKNMKRAEAAFLQALRYEPRDTECLMHLAHLYSEILGEPRKAMKQLDALLKIEPQDWASWRQKAILYHEYLGEAAKALAAYQEARRIKDDFDLMTRMGWLLWENLGRTEEGILLIETAHSLAPENAWVLTHLGQARLMAEGDIRAAEACLKQAIALEPDYEWPRAYYAYLAFEYDADLEKAEAYFLSAVKLSPDYIWAWHGLGRLYLFGLKDYDRAMAAFATLLRLDPDHVDALLDFVWMGLYGLGRPDLVMDKADKLIRLAPESGTARAVRAGLKRLMGDRLAAGSDLLKAIALENDDAYIWHELGAWALFDAGHHTLAALAFSEALKLDPAYAPAQMDQAFLKYLEKDLNGALELAQKASAQEPDDYQLWLSYARLLILSGEQSDILELAFEAIEALGPARFETFAIKASANIGSFLQASEKKQAERLQTSSLSVDLWEPGLLQAAKNHAPKGLDLEAWLSNFWQGPAYKQENGLLRGAEAFENGLKEADLQRLQSLVGESLKREERFYRENPLSDLSHKAGKIGQKTTTIKNDAQISPDQTASKPISNNNQPVIQAVNIQATPVQAANIQATPVQAANIQATPVQGGDIRKTHRPPRTRRS